MPTRHSWNYHLPPEYPHPSSATPAASPVLPICASLPSAEGTSLVPASAAQSSCGTLVSPHLPLPQATNRKQNAVNLHLTILLSQVHNETTAESWKIQIWKIITCFLFFFNSLLVLTFNSRKNHQQTSYHNTEAFSEFCFTIVINKITIRWKITDLHESTLVFYSLINFGSNSKYTSLSVQHINLSHPEYTHLQFVCTNADMSVFKTCKPNSRKTFSQEERIKKKKWNVWCQPGGV